MSFKGLVIGVSGLKSQSKKMEVVSNNLSNINTTGFKKGRVNFTEMFSDVYRSASAGDGQDIGGTNPMTIGSGVQVGSIDKVFTQGSRVATSRTLDFMVEGEDFFVVKNAANSSLMLTRNGNFQLDANRSLVDSSGNRVIGFNVDRETGVVDQVAGNITVPTESIDPNATTDVEIRNNIDATANERPATGDTNAWEVFSGGENFGAMTISSLGSSGTRDTFGSGYYQDNVIYQDTAAAINVALDTVTLNAAPTNLVEGFQVGDTISILQGTNQVQRTITAVNTGTREITLDSAAPAGFAAGALTITNISRATAAEGTSGTTDTHNDILRSQVSMVDDDGNILASFYRVSGPPKQYTRATATVTGGASTVTIGTGEFTSISELKDNIVRALQDTQLTNYATSTNLDVSLDKFGAISFGGTGLVQQFRLVMNADNTEMLDRFNGIAMTDAAAVATTQARIDASGEIIAPAALALGNRTVNASKAWFATNGLETYGYNANAPATEYGHVAGLRLDSGANGTGFGVLQLSMTNGLGVSKTREFKLVPRSAEPSENEFTNMEELAELLQNTLRTADFSTVANSGVLLSDNTATVTFSNGRLGVSTTQGVFNNFQLTPVNTNGDTENSISLSDQATFGTVLGELATGFSGKAGASNEFIKADARVQTRVHDSQGNEHTAVVNLVKDRSAGLTNVEWKFQSGLNPNLNTFSEENDASNVYGNTFNTIQTSTLSRGVVAFDINTGAVLDGTQGGSGSDPRYSKTAQLTFQSKLDSLEASLSNITIDFSKMSSFEGNTTAVGQNIDGFEMGTLVRLSTEQNTGKIQGVYSNGKIRTLAKIGLMQVENPEGLQKVGSSYFLQTPNANEATKGLDQVFTASPDEGESQGTVSSKIHGNALEGSNVDLTEELTDMILTQRSYSASGKIITTSDDMLQEALNLKR